jgi:hypothetical protein
VKLWGLRRVFSILIIFNLVTTWSKSQEIWGFITDISDQQPVAGALITIFSSQSTHSSYSDSTGQYAFSGLHTGRYTVQVTHLGYRKTETSAMLIRSFESMRYDFELEKTQIALEPIIVRSRARNSPEKIGTMHEITLEETERIPANFFDPARIVNHFPGVIQQNDQSNHLVVRGSSPNFLLWSIEGLEVVNPNHLSNAGSFSDRPAQSGGSVNVLAPKIMESARLYKSPIPHQTGSGLAGLIDISLKLPDRKKQHYSLQAGLLGLDLFTEGPLGREKQIAYAINYRYSTVGLLSNLGVDFGGEKINYQDISFVVDLPGKKKGPSFRFFGFWGKSYKEILGIGIKGRHLLDHRSYLQGGIIYSEHLARRIERRLNSSFMEDFFRFDKSNRAMYSGFIEYVRTTGNDTRIAIGLQAKQNDQRFEMQETHAPNNLLFDNGNIFRPYVSLQTSVARVLAISSGIGLQIYSATHQIIPSPFFRLRWEISENTNLSFSVGADSQATLSQIQTDSLAGKKEVPLDAIPAVFFDLTFSRKLSSSRYFSASMYWQKFWHVPVAESIRGTYSIMNYPEPRITEQLYNVGKARNFGMEFSYGQHLEDNWYYHMSSSLYRAQYTGSENIWKDGRYDGRFSIQLIAGKERRIQKNSAFFKTMGLSVRFIIRGGFRENSIDVEQSELLEKTVFSNDEFPLHQDAYFRPDVSIYWLKDKKKLRSRLSIDIQNFISYGNSAFKKYDSVRGKVFESKQLGIIPVISYRIDF